MSERRQTPREPAWPDSLAGQAASDCVGDRELSPSDRRRTPRFEPVEFRVWLGWWLDPERFHAIAARLQNISRGGGLVEVDDLPPDDQPIWMRLEGAAATECVEASVVEVARNNETPHQIRLQFPAPCPIRFYKMAVEGLLACVVAPDGRIDFFAG